MKSPETWPSEQQLRERLNLARSLISHRPHSPELVDLIDLALSGANVDDLRTIESYLRSTT